MDSTLFCVMFKDAEAALNVGSQITQIANTIAASLQEILSPSPQLETSEPPEYSEGRPYGKPTDFNNGGRDMGPLDHAKTPLPGGVVVSPEFADQRGSSVKSSMSTSSIITPSVVVYAAARRKDSATDGYAQVPPVEILNDNGLDSGRGTGMSQLSPNNTSGYSAMPAMPSSPDSSGYVDLRASTPSPYQLPSQASLQSASHHDPKAKIPSASRRQSASTRKNSRKSSAGLTVFDGSERIIDLSGSGHALDRSPSVFNSLNLMSEDPNLLAALPQPEALLPDGHKSGYAVPTQLSAEELQMELGIAAPSKQFIRKLSQNIIRGPNDQIVVQYAN